MSPTATIVTVIAALFLLAWLFQTPTYDPGYEAWLKRQSEMQNERPAHVAGPNVVAPNVTDERSLEQLQRDVERDRLRALSAAAAPPILPRELPDPDVDPFQGPTVPTASPISRHDGPADAGPHDPGRPDRAVANENGFPANHLLNGTYAGIAYVDDTPRRSEKGEEPAITFRRDGTFATRNMAAADVDMQPAKVLGAALDRGAGRYNISGIHLNLTYTDGLQREKGNQRHYVIKPLAGPEDAPTAITIQGKTFLLDAER